MSVPEPPETPPHDEPDAVTPPEQAVPGVADPERPRLRRPHPITPLLRGGVFLGALCLFAVQRLTRDGLDQLQHINWLIVGGIILGILLLATAVSFVSWWATRFIVDDEECRVETGVLFKSSKRVPFERMQSIDIRQPLTARLFGLAEIQIDAGSDSVTLRYLSRDRATAMRDQLSARARGDHLDPTAAPTTPTRLHDADTDVLVHLPTKTILTGMVLSPEFLIAIIGTMIVLVVMIVLGWWWMAVPMVLPTVIGLVSTVVKRSNQFNYTLSRPADASGTLRVARGLTSLTSQTVPVDRVQAVRMRQSALWRHLDLWQVEIDMLKAPGEIDETMLLPVAPRADVETALAHIWPGLHWQHVPLEPVPRRARWLRPIGWRFIRRGLDERLAVSISGWLVRTIDVVPRTKIQSVRATQGPVQRRLDLATVHIDTTPGPVHWEAAHLSATAARTLVEESRTLVTQPEMTSPAVTVRT